MSKKKPTDSLLPILLLTLVAGYVVITVHGQSQSFQIISTYLGLNDVNGFATQNQTLSGICLGLGGVYNFTIPASNGSLLYVEIICPEAQDLYTFSIWGWLPLDVIITSSQSCVVQNNLAYNLSQAPQPGVTQAAFRSPSYNVSSPTRPMASVSWGLLGSIGTAVACAGANYATGNLAGAFGGPCSPSSYGPSWADLQSIETLNSEQWAAQDLVNQGLQNWTMVAGQEINYLLTGLQDARQYQIDNTEAVNNLTLVAIQQQTQINEIAGQTSAALNYINGQIQVTQGLVYQTANAVSTLASQTASEFNQTLADMAQLTVAINGQLYNMSYASYLFQISTTSKFQTVSQTLLGLAFAIQGIITGQQFVPSLRQLFNAQQQAVSSFGSPGQYQFFLDYMGFPGQPDPYHITDPTLVSFPIETIQLKYLFLSGPPGPDQTVQAAWSSLQWTCSGIWLSTNQVPPQSWSQLMNDLGPDGCSVNSNPVTGQGLNFCNCWIQLVEQGCSINSSGGVPLAPALALWQAYNLPGLPAPGSPDNFCQSDLRPSLGYIPPLLEIGPLQYIRNQTDFMTYQVALCQRGAISQSNGYQIFSSYFGTYFQTPYSLLPCGGSLTQVMNPPTGDPANVVYGMNNFFRTAFGAASTSFATIATKILGSLPLNTTITTDLYQNLGIGSVGECQTMNVVATDTTDFIAVYKLKYEGQQKNVIVLVNGVQTAEFSDGVLTNEFSSLLPPDGSLIYQVRNTPLFQQQVYDINWDEMDGGPNAVQREGDTGYMMFPPNANGQPPFGSFNITTWRQNNYVAFNHLAAFNSPKQYKTLVNNGQCVGQPGPASDGDQCTILTKYNVEQFGNTLTFSSPYNQLGATVNVPQGPMTAIVGSACPSLSSAIASPNEVTITMYNQLALNNEIQVVETGACGKTNTVLLAPQQTYFFNVTYCSLQPTGTPIGIKLFANPGLPNAIECNNTFEVVINPTNPAVFQSAPTFGATEVQRAVSADQSLINVQQAITNQIVLQNALTIAMMQVFAFNGIPVTNDTLNPLGPFASVIALANEIAQNASTALTNSQAYQFSYSASVVNYSESNAALLAQAQNANEAAANDTARLSNDINNALYTQQILNGITIQNAVRLNESENSLNVMNAAIAQIIANGEARGNNNLGDLLGPLTNFLSGVGGFGEGLVHGAVGLLENLGADAADCVKGMLSGVTGVVNIIVLVLIVIGAIGLLGAIGYVIYYCVSKRKTDEKSTVSMEALRRYIEKKDPGALKTIEDQIILERTNQTANNPNTKGRRNQRHSGRPRGRSRSPPREETRGNYRSPPRLRYDQPDDRRGRYEPVDTELTNMGDRSDQPPDPSQPPHPF